MTTKARSYDLSTNVIAARIHRAQLPVYSLDFIADWLGWPAEVRDQ